MSNKKDLGKLVLENFKDAAKLKPKLQAAVTGPRPTSSEVVGNSGGKSQGSGGTEANQGKSSK